MRRKINAETYSHHCFYKIANHGMYLWYEEADASKINDKLLCIICQDTNKNIVSWM